MLCTEPSLRKHIFAFVFLGTRSIALPPDMHGQGKLVPMSIFLLQIKIVKNTGLAIALIHISKHIGSFEVDAEDNLGASLRESKHVYRHIGHIPR